MVEEHDHTEIFNSPESDIFGIKISSPKNLATENQLWMVIDCGKFGSDWLAISVCHYITERLIFDAGSRDSYFNYMIFPMLNPDGYEYTWTTDRTWQKNLRDHQGYGSKNNFHRLNFCYSVLVVFSYHPSDYSLRRYIVYRIC